VVLSVVLGVVIVMAHFGLNLFEKLIDDRGDDVAHTSIDRLKDSVARDVEALLNSRCGLRDQALAGLPHSQRSVLSFGLKDFVSMCLGSEGDRAAICEDIRRCLLRHEPRLQGPQIEVSRAEGPGQRLHFSIKALLVAHEANEVVNFDAVLMPVNQRYQVQRARGI
jgi:type VI secretion system protein ImpF